MTSGKDAIQEKIDKGLGDEHADQKQKLREFANDITEGKTPKDAMGLSDDYVEGMYSFAYRLYTMGKYDQALQLFRLMVMLNPMESRYLLGLAACYHMLKDYDNASSSYMLCSILDPDDPLPYYHASDCFLQLEDLPMAYDSLRLCIIQSEGKPDYDQIKNRAEVSMEVLKQTYKPVEKKKTKKKKAA